MVKNSIYEQFKELNNKRISDTQQGYNVLPIEGTQHKLGVSSEGYPMFFIKTKRSQTAPRNILLNILKVEYSVPCKFRDDSDQEIDDLYTIITLQSEDDSLYYDFIDIVILMLHRLEDEPSTRNIAIEVENLSSIFSAMNCPPLKKIQGLWAELLVIEQSRKPDVLINAWHTQTNAKYDFTLGRDKIEVKSTRSEVRKHHFSLDQLNPTPHSQLLIASVVVRESGHGNGGKTLRDLYNLLSDKVNSNNAKLRLYQIIITSLGNDYKHFDDECFDYIGAKDSLKYFDYHLIPGIDKSNVDQGVSSVGFDSDLSGVIDINSPESNFDVSSSPLYKSLF